MSARSLSDPRLRALYLGVIAVGVFLLPDWWMVAGALALQMLLWPAVGLEPRRLVRQLYKLSVLLAVIQVAYTLLSPGPGAEKFGLTIPWLGWTVDVYPEGARFGLTMVLRILTVVLASHVCRAGDPRALASGLGRLGLPKIAAMSIDAVLALLGADELAGKGGGGGGKGGGGGGKGGGGGGKGGGGGGKGGGGGSGRRHQHDLAAEDGESRGRFRRFLAAIRRLARGDVSAIADPMRKHIARVEAHVARNDEGGDPTLHRDVAIIAGIALTMLGIKMLKLLPGLPFAPGHKGVLLIPLYIAAGYLTKSRFGATITGLTMGAVAFLMGDGRYGVFEIAKHIAPGLIVDLVIPWFKRAPAGRGTAFWAALGLAAAVGRFATVMVIALAVQAPALVYAIFLPGLAAHAAFGFLSGAITAPLLKGLQRDDNAPIDVPSGEE